MKAKAEYHHDNALVRVVFSDGPANVSLSKVLETLAEDVASRSISRIYLDFTALQQDIHVRELLALQRDCRAVIRPLCAARVAAAIGGELIVAVQVMTLMFNSGVKVAVFNDADLALEWLTLPDRKN